MTVTASTDSVDQWLICRINTPVLRDIFMSSFDLFDTRNGLLAILAGDFYEKPSSLSL